MSTEKRALLATFLSILFLIAWQRWLAPHPPEPPPGAVAPAEAPAEEPGAGAAGGPSGVAGGSAGGAAEDESRPPLPVKVSPAVAGGAERVLVLESRAARVKLTSAGARILSWRLLDYQDDEGHPLELVPEAQEKLEALPLDIVVLGDAERSQRLNEAPYECEGPREASGGHEITCRWSDGERNSVEKTLFLPEKGYVATLRMRVAVPGAARAFVSWAPGMMRHPDPLAEKQPARATHLVLANGGKLERISPDTGGRWEPSVQARAWGGIEGQYFAVALIPERGPAHFALLGRAREEQHPAVAGVAWAPEGAAAARLFVGPKSYDLLRQVDAELHVGVSRLLDFGYFEFIAVPLFLIMKWLNQHLNSYGLAIIILTFLIKLIFYPITQRTMVNMRRLQTQMKRVQPRVQHLKEQYARKGRSMKARQEMHEQMMELYRREGINPMAGMTGCLPLLLQIPILWAFYNLLSTAIELRRAPFLYLRDLSAQDPYYITPIIMGATMWIQQRMSGTAMPEPSQRLIMNLMPVFMTYVFLSFPSGLVLYWLVNNILSIGQQYLINRQAEAAEATAGRDKAAARRA